MAVAALARTPLAFDHAAIIAAALVPPTFTIPALRSVRAIVTGDEQDSGNFRRRVHRMIADGVIKRGPGKRITASKPAVLYRFRT